MNVKTVRVPVVSVEEPVTVAFLELAVAPDDDRVDPFAALGQGGLTRSADLARHAQTTLPTPTRRTAVEVVSREMALASADGAALALALAPHVMELAVPYARFVISGAIDLAVDGGFRVVDSGGLDAKMAAVADAGYQEQATLLIIPNSPELALDRSDYLRLADSNIALRRVDTLAEAYRCLTGYLPVSS